VKNETLALGLEDIYASTGTNWRDWATLTATERMLIRKTTNENEKPINEGLPPRKTGKERTGRTVLTPLTNWTMNAMKIERLNATDRAPPRTNHYPQPPSRLPYFSYFFHHLLPLKKIRKIRQVAGRTVCGGSLNASLPEGSIH